MFIILTQWHNVGIESVYIGWMREETQALLTVADFGEPKVIT